MKLALSAFILMFATAMSGLYFTRPIDETWAQRRTAKISFSIQGDETLVSNTVLMGHGSGIIVSDGLILTNYHVIAGRDITAIQFGDNAFSSATVTVIDPIKDLALVQVEKRHNVTPISLDNGFYLGEELIIVGSAKTDFNLVHTHITAIDVIPHGLYPMTMMIFPCNGSGQGYSGGPVFSNRGDLLGIFELIYDDPNDGRCAAIPIREAKEIREAK